MYHGHWQKKRNLCTAPEVPEVMESLWVPMQELVPAGGRQRLDQFKPKLVEPMLEPPQGLVGKEQNDPGECLEEDKSKGVPGREEAHADEKVQAKEGGNVGMKSDEVPAGQGLGWRVANARPCCCSGRCFCPLPPPPARWASHLLHIGTGTSGSHKFQLK